MTFPDDPSRPLGTDRPLGTSRPFENERSRGMAWGALAVIALLVIGGFLFYSSDTNRTDTASNNPTASKITPIPTPGPTTPAPAPTPKQ